MEATSKQRKSIDIQTTAHLHKTIASQLLALAAHTLSGWDIVAQLWGIGKTRVVKVLKASRQLSELWNSNAALSGVVQESTAFIAACYGYEEAATMPDVRFKMWKMKTAKANIVSAPKLMSLLPTNESFQPNVLIAHLQCCIWKHADEANPPAIDPTMYGLNRYVINKTWTPTLFPGNTPAAPDSILQLIKCGCESCKSARCLRSRAMLPCTIFCGCECGLDCSNEHAKTAVEVTPDDEDIHLES